MQLTCDPRPLFQRSLPRDEVALPLGELRPPLAVADDAADEQHHEECDDREPDPAPGRTGDGESHERRERHRCRTDGEESGPRPDGERIHRAQPGDPVAHDRGRFPGDRDDVGEQPSGNAGTRGIPAADGDCAGHERPGDGDHESLAPTDGPDPGLELGHDRQRGRHDQVDLHWVDPEAAETQKARAHVPKLDGSEPHVINLSADPAAPEDQTFG